MTSHQGRIEYMGKILSIDKQSLRMRIVLTEYHKEGFGDGAVVFSKQTLFLDAQGNRTDFAALKKGMYIDFLGRALSPDTLTLLATRIQIIGPTARGSHLPGRDRFAFSRWHACNHINHIP